MSLCVEERYCFLVEWFDPVSSLKQKFNLLFYPGDNTLEMINLKQRKTFLKRCGNESIKLADLFIGAKITLYSRLLDVIDYGDDFTRNKFKLKDEAALMLVDYQATPHLGNVVSELYHSGLRVTNMKILTMSKEQLLDFSHIGNRDFENELCSLSFTAIEARGPKACEMANELRERLNAKFGKNVVISSASPADAEHEIHFFFDHRRKWADSAQFENSTLCVIKPHAIVSGYLGPILDDIIDIKGLRITALEMKTLDTVSAEEFLEVYKDVMPHFKDLVTELMAGPCVAMEITGDNAVTTMRDIAGPFDPEVAKLLRPTSLRAKYGINKAKNAVHVTDLIEDGVLEVEYFFKILQNK